MVKRRLILTGALLGALLMLGALQCRAATIAVQPGRNPVSQNESFRLTFSAKGSVDGDPDFSPLRKDFEILGRSKSSQINIINGHFSRQTSWILEVMAKRAGVLTIPPIHFGRDASPAARLTVTRTAAAQASGAGHGRDLFLKVTASPKDPYVQAQVIYTVRLYRAVDLESATLSDPKPSAGDAIIEKLGKAVQYQTRRNGRPYAVIERKYAIFPQKSGTVTVSPVVFQGQVVENAPAPSTPAGAFNQFNDFFNHFNGLFNQQRVHTVRLASSPVSLHVRPVPAAFKGSTWLPAKKLVLRSGWADKPLRWQVGVPVTRTLSVQAVGLTAAQLPSLAPELGDGLKQYPDEPSLEQEKKPGGVTGRRLEKVAIMPSRAGTYTLPAIRIPWWNTTTDRMEVARLPSRVIHVAAAMGLASAAAPPAAAAGAAASGAPVPPSPSRPAKPRSPPPGPSSASAPRRKTTPWLWISLLLGAGWAGSVLALAMMSKRRRRRRRKRKKASAPAPSRRKRPGPGEAWESLRQACTTDDPGAVKEALLAWAQLRWPQLTPTTLEDVCRVCSPQAGEPIRALGARLYGRAGRQGWSGETLWEALQQQDEPQKVASGASEGGLEPLYKL